MWESWVVLGIFVLNLVFLLIMSFVSPYFKALTAQGIGKIFNLIWICVIITAAAILMFYNMQCTLGSNSSGSSGSSSSSPGSSSGIADTSCKRLAIAVVVFLALLTVLNLSWNIYNTIEYNKTKAATTTQESKH